MRGLTAEPDDGPVRGSHTPEQAALGLSQADRRTIILAELKPADQLLWWQISFHSGAGGLGGTVCLAGLS